MNHCQQYTFVDFKIKLNYLNEYKTSYILPLSCLENVSTTQNRKH